MILRVKKDRAYSVVANAPFNNTSLSWKARGILAYLLTKPDDWEIVVADLLNQSEKDGRESLRGGLNELREAGYLVLVDRRDENGRFLGRGYDLHESPGAVETPQEPAVPEQPQPAEAQPGLFGEMEAGEAEPKDGFPVDPSTERRVSRPSVSPTVGKSPPTKYLSILNTELSNTHTQIAREKEIFGEKYRGVSGVALQNAVKKDAAAWLKSDPLGVETWVMMCDPHGYKEGPEAVVAEWVPKQTDQTLREWLWHINGAASYLANIARRSKGRQYQAQAPAAPIAPSAKFNQPERTRSVPKV